MTTRLFLLFGCSLVPALIQCTDIADVQLTKGQAAGDGGDATAEAGAGSPGGGSSATPNGGADGGDVSSSSSGAGMHAGASGDTGSGGDAGASSTAGSATGGDSGGGTGPVGGSNTGGVVTGGTGGKGGAGGAGGASGCGSPTACIGVVANAPSSFGNAGWKDSWWVVGCDQKNQNDCITNGQTCNASDGPTPEEKGARTTESWTLGGVKGQHYKVTFTYNAITELKRYKSGTRDQAVVESDPHNTPLDTFYRDGTEDLSNYNVYKLKIFDDAGVEKRHFYMNSAPDTGALTEYESHFTFLSSYTKSIVVIGGGRVEHFVEDSNCHAIDNCGPDFVQGAACPVPRKLPGGDDTLTLPLKYQDPKDGMIKDTTLLTAGYPNPGLVQPWHAQAAHLKITAIQPTSDPVTINY